MLYLIFILSLFAHEDLGSTRCEFEKQQIHIKKISKQKYEIQTPDMKKPQSFSAPQVKDYWDPKNKQMFDTYTFKHNDFSLVVKRPETKGPITTKMAEWKNKNFKCQ